MSTRQQRQPIRFDAILLLLTMALLIVGLVMVYSSSYGYAYEGDDSGPGDSLAFFKRQAMWAGLGVVGLLVAMRLDFRMWGRRPWLYRIGGVTLVLLVMMIFTEGRSIQVGPVGGQPSEFAKMGVIIYMAAWLATPGRDVRNLWLGLVPFLLLMGVPVVITLLDPDFSTALILGLTLTGMYLVAGAGLREIGIVLSGGFSGLVAGGLLTEDFRMGRLLAWVRGEPGEQLSDVLMAFGRGGMFGVGLGNSTAKLRVYAAHSDCILAVIGEEFGLIGSLVVMALYALWIWRGLRIASQCQDRFGALLAQGFAGWVAFQVIVNVGALTGSLPFTGTVLPFLSGGGSSLMTLLIGTGLLLSISAHERPRRVESAR